MQRDRSTDTGERGLWRVSRRSKSASEDLQISSTLLSETRVTKISGSKTPRALCRSQKRGPATHGQYVTLLALRES